MVAGVKKQTQPSHRLQDNIRIDLSDIIRDLNAYISASPLSFFPNRHRPAHTALDIVVDGGWVCASGPNGELLNRKKLVYVKTSGIQIRVKPKQQKCQQPMHVFNRKRRSGDPFLENASLPRRRLRGPTAVRPDACCVLCGLSNPGKAAPLLATAIARLLATFRRELTVRKKCHILGRFRRHT